MMRPTVIPQDGSLWSLNKMREQVYAHLQEGVGYAFLQEQRAAEVKSEEVGVGESNQQVAEEVEESSAAGGGEKEAHSGENEAGAEENAQASKQGEDADEAVCEEDAQYDLVDVEEMLAYQLAEEVSKVQSLEATVTELSTKYMAAEAAMVSTRRAQSLQNVIKGSFDGVVRQLEVSLQDLADDKAETRRRENIEKNEERLSSKEIQDAAGLMQDIVPYQSIVTRLQESLGAAEADSEVVERLQAPNPNPNPNPNWRLLRGFRHRYRRLIPFSLTLCHRRRRN